MFRRFLMTLAVVALTATAASVNAAHFTVSPVFMGAFDNAFNPIAGYDPATNPGTPAILQYDFKLDFEPTGTETFGAVVFDLTLTGLGNTAVPGWQANNPGIDFNGPTPGGNAPLFANAGDFGTAGDLKNITAGVAAGLTTNPAIDPRLMVGRGMVVAGNDLDLLGTMYVEWDGSSTAGIDVEVKEGGYRNAADGMLIVDTAAVLAGVDVALGGGGELPGIFASTPDPGSVLDFGFGPNTRTLQLAVRNAAAAGALDVEVAQAVISGANASLFSTPGFAPLDLVAGAAATNIGVQFNGIGTPGVYSAILTLLDDAGATLGTYTLTAQVPEPSTIALAGLGLVGLVGFLRRRG